MDVLDLFLVTIIIVQVCSQTNALCLHHDYVTAPSDYGTTDVDFVFGPGVDRVCANVPIVNDDIFEGVENFFASLTTSDSAVTLSPDEAEVIILEDPDDGEN